MAVVMLALLVLGQVYLSDEGGTEKAVRHINCSGAGITCSSSSTFGTITVAGGGSVPAACGAGEAVTSNGAALVCTATLTASDVVCAGTCVADAEIAAVSGAKVSGAVATASALAANPAACGANNFVTDIAADGTLTCAQPAFTNLSGAASIAQGGTTETQSTEDAVLVGASTTDWQAKVLPDCDDTGGNHLNYDTGTNAFSCGTTGGGSGAPTDAVYWTGAAHASLSAEKDLSALSTGLVINTAGTPSAYGGASCTNQFPRSTNASGAWTCATITDTDVPNTITIDQATLALAAQTLAADPADCSAGQYASGIDETGLPTCSQVSVATALASDPADCAANRYATAIDSSGTLTCGQVSLSAGVTGTLPVANGGSGVTQLGGDVGVAVNASYVTVFTVTGATIGNSKNVWLEFHAVYIATANTVGMQFRVRSADTGYVGNCNFITWGISGTAASATAIETDIIAIGTNPADTAAAAACAAAPCIADIECSLTSDASAGDVVLEAQLETGTSNANIKAGSTWYRLLTN